MKAYLHSKEDGPFTNKPVWIVVMGLREVRVSSNSEEEARNRVLFATRLLEAGKIKWKL